MKRTLRWLAGAVLLIVATIVVAALTRPTSLLDRATPLADARKWHDHVWLSDSRFLLVREGYGIFKVISVDLATGIKTRMTGLESALNQFHNEGIIPSPDGRWLMCLPFDGEEFAHFVTLDGKDAREVSVGGNLDLAWMPESGRWIDVSREFDQNLQAWRILRVRTADLKSRGWRMSLDASKSAPSGEGIYGQGPIVTADGSLLLPHQIQKPGTYRMMGIRLDRYDLHPDRVAFQGSTRVMLPGYRDGDDDFSISPDGKEVAWTATHQEPTLLSRLLGRFIPRFSGKADEITTIRVQNLAGGPIRDLGSQNFGSQSQEIWGLKWLPGSRRLAFFSKDRLWSIDAG